MAGLYFLQTKCSYVFPYIVGVFLVHTLPSAVAFAQEPDATAAEPAPQGVEEAKRHFEKGASLYKEGLYRAAAFEFDAAYRLAKLPDLLFNMAQAARSLGNYRQAIHYLELYLAEGALFANEKEKQEIKTQIESIQREMSLQEAEVARRTTALLVPQKVEGKKPKASLPKGGLALLGVSGGLLVTGIGLGIAAAVTAENLKTAPYFDPSLVQNGLAYERAGIGLSVASGVVFGASATWLLVHHLQHRQKETPKVAKLAWRGF